MTAPPLSVRRVDAASLEDVLPLIAGYQRFYEVADPDDARNRAFFARFAGPDSPYGVLLAAYDGDAAVGFACVYWTQESVAAEDVALLHDLFVAEEARGRGAGRALMDRAAEEARGRGLAMMSWMTQVDNRTAQRLYESYPARRAAYFEYELDL